MRALLALTSLLALLIIPSTASAMACFDREQLESFLANDLDAETIGMGVDQYGNLLRMHVTPSKNFAITITPAQDTSMMCFLLEGTGWAEKPKLDKES